MLNCEDSLGSGVGASGHVPGRLQSAKDDWESAMENLLFLEDANDPLNADKGAVVELSQEWQVFVEEGHAERTLVADELNLLASQLNLLAGELKLLGGELFVRHLA